MLIYALIVTAVAVIFIINSFKWKIAARAVTLFCKENFREPTDKEIADYSKKAADKSLRFK